MRGGVFWSHEREEEDVADRLCICEEHDEAVDADADAAGWWHPLADRFDELFVERIGFCIAFVSFFALVRQEAAVGVQDR